MWWEKALSTWWMSITCPINAAKIVRVNLCSYYWSPLQGQACGKTLIFCWDARIAGLLGITPASDRMGQQSLWTVRNNQSVVCWTVHSTRTILIATPSRHLDPRCHPDPWRHAGPPRFTSSARSFSTIWAAKCARRALPWKALRRKT